MLLLERSGVALTLTPRLPFQYKAKGDESGLHIIIFDELDAICKQRGSTGGGTGVGDSVVNQLLSKVSFLLLYRAPTRRRRSPSSLFLTRLLPPFLA